MLINRARFALIALGSLALVSPALAACRSAQPSPASTSTVVLTPAAVTVPEPKATRGEIEPTTIEPIVPFKESGSVTFSLDAAEQSLPQDVLAQVSVTMGDGSNADTGCGAVTQPTLAASVPNEPRAELLAIVDMVGCGWPFSATVIVTVKTPGDQALDFQADVEPDGGFDLPFETALTDPAGVYTFEAKIDGGAIASATITLSQPDGPRLRSYGDRVYLYGFHPGEAIRLLAYQFSQSKDRYEFAGWQRFTMDADGRLSIDLDESAQGPLFAFGVVGEASGPVTEFAKIGRIEKLAP